MNNERQAGGVSAHGPYLAASEAAKELGISLPTLYAYVSRGLVRSEVEGGQRRTRRYHAEDIARLRARKEARRDPGGAARRTLAWGMPVLDSAITLIVDGRLHYRGCDAIELALTHSFEEVASLIWLDRLDGAPSDLFAGPGARQLERLAPWQRLRGLNFIETFQTVLPLMATQDPAAFDLRRPERTWSKPSRR